MLAEGSGPAVLLLHGSGPGTTAAWAPLVAALAPRHRVIAPDLLGFGAEPRPAGSFRSAWTEQALGVVDSLGIASFAVVGNSAPLRDGLQPLLELLPDVRAHVFGRCGHASPLERTAQFNRLLTTFLEADR